jgi:hypothetical protein
MDHIVEQMEAFPPGGWSLDAYDTFFEWCQDLKAIEGSKTLRKASTQLLDLGAAFGKLQQPLEMDDETSDDDGEYEVEAPIPSGSAKGKAREALDTIVSKPRVTRGGPAAPPTVDEGLILISPKVT